MSQTVELVDYRSRVSTIYANVRSGGVGRDQWLEWVEARNALFKTHPQSPIEDQIGFTGLPYFEYEPELRTHGTLVEADPSPWGEFERIGSVDFELGDSSLSLPAYWLRAYGGGLFLPFGDQTNGIATYGGGRYLLDTAKGADLGHSGDKLILDFNYAYHPSCTHSSRWVCPLAAPESRLGVPIEGGERLSGGHGHP